MKKPHTVTTQDLSSSVLNTFLNRVKTAFKALRGDFMNCSNSCLSCQYVLSNCFFWHENLLVFTATVNVENQTKPEIPSPATEQASIAFWKYKKGFLD